MDDIELLVVETYQHFKEHFPEENEEVLEEDTINEEESELPTGPGLLYHIQRSSSIFVIRTFVSTNVHDDYLRVLEKPEDFPSLRLIEEGVDNIAAKLRFFLVDESGQAEIIHDQLNNRRFPVNEEVLCNLSDPGFSWWLTSKGKGFQLSFTLSVSGSAETMKLGALGDRELALKNFQLLEGIFTDAGLTLEMHNEVNRVQFTGGEEFLLEELKDIFEYGVLSESMGDLFKIIAKKVKDISILEMTWFYLQEVAAIRRFWIQVQYDLNSHARD